MWTCVVKGVIERQVNRNTYHTPYTLVGHTKILGMCNYMAKHFCNNWPTWKHIWWLPAGLIKEVEDLHPSNNGTSVSMKKATQFCLIFVQAHFFVTWKKHFCAIKLLNTYFAYTIQGNKYNNTIFQSSILGTFTRKPFSKLYFEYPTL